MTHAELVARAARWLKAQGYTTIVAEKYIATDEEPDAIGWKGQGWSMLVEVKTSRADFRRDAAKPFRKFPALGMGLRRVFMAMPGVIPQDELPAGWGLVETTGRSCRIVVKPGQFTERNLRAELSLVLARSRRLDRAAKAAAVGSPDA